MKEFELVILILLLLITGYIIWGLYVSKKHQYAKHRNNFFLMLINVFIWILSILITEKNYDNTIVSLWASRISFTSAILIAYFYYLFVESYRNNANIIRKRKSFYFWTIVTALLVLITLTDKVLVNVRLIGSNLVSEFGTLYPLTGIYLIAFFVFSNIAFFKIYRTKSNHIVKVQIKYIMTGSIISIFLSLATNIVSPMLGLPEIRPLGPFTIIIFLIFTYYAIIRYRFLSIRLIFGSFVKYLCVSIIPYSSFFLIFFLQTRLWGDILVTESLLTGLFLSFAFTIVFIFFYNRVSKLIDKLIIHNKYDLDIILEDASKQLSAQLELVEINKIVAKILKKNLGYRYLYLHLPNNNKYLDKNNLSKKTIANIEKFGQSLNKPFIIRDEIEYLYDSYEVRYLVQIMKEQRIEIIANMSLLVENMKGFIIIGEKRFYEEYPIEEIKFIRQICLLTALSAQRSLLFSKVREFNNDLKKEVKKATFKLENKISDLNEIRRRERDMIDIMGHELRTPMVIISNEFYLLDKIIRKHKSILKGPDAEKYEKHNKNIVEGIQREIGLIKTFLDSTKIEGKGLDLNLEEVDIGHVIENSIISQKALAEDKGIRINYSQYGHKLPRINADKVRIQEVFDNIINNAVKYTNKGFVKIIVDYDDNYLRVRVKDSGIGIPDEYIKKLGTKFFRVNQYSSQSEEFELVRPGGTGLGLYVSYGVVKGHGGTIEINSEKDKGTEFIIKLPRYVAGKK